MRSAARTVACVAAVLLTAQAWAPERSERLGAQEATKPTRTARGGTLVDAGIFRFEVFFYPTGARVFVQDGAREPIDASRLAATATFAQPNSTEVWFARPLHAAPTPAGQPSASLDLSADLTGLPPEGVRVTFHVEGLPTSAQSTATFAVPFALVPSRSAPVLPRRAPAVIPPYEYGHGYAGYGYYRRYAADETVPARTEGSGVAPTRAPPGSRRNQHPFYIWWRDKGVEKPWMRPMD